jgi:hypothetical protein
MIIYWLLGVAAAAVLALLLYWWLRPTLKHSSGSNPLQGDGGHSVWSFQSGRWSLLEDKSAPGYVHGPPPAGAGQHEGYCLRVTSSRKPGAP